MCFFAACVYSSGNVDNNGNNTNNTLGVRPALPQLPEGRSRWDGSVLGQRNPVPFHTAERRPKPWGKTHAAGCVDANGAETPDRMLSQMRDG